MNQHDPSDITKMAAMAQDAEVRGLTSQLFNRSCDFGYSYNFQWLGRPIIQYPEDIMAIQEIIWKVKPEVIIETGIAHGGSLILSASILELMGGDRQVIGIDLDIRHHNRQAIEAHRLAPRIKMIEGSSVDETVAQQVKNFCRDSRPILVILDSNHTHDHVARELDIYSPLVGRDSYLIVLDTVIEDMPEEAFPNRPWSKGNNPKTAVQEFLRRNERFVVDSEIQNKLLLTVAPSGYLRCVAD